MLQCGTSSCGYRLPRFGVAPRVGVMDTHPHLSPHFGFSGFFAVVWFREELGGYLVSSAGEGFFWGGLVRSGGFLVRLGRGLARIVGFFGFSFFGLGWGCAGEGGGGGHSMLMGQKQRACSVCPCVCRLVVVVVSAARRAVSHALASASRHQPIFCRPTLFSIFFCLLQVHSLDHNVAYLCDAAK